MNAPAAYLPEAEDDVSVAYASYEAQRPGLGQRFLDAVSYRVGEIRSNPQLYGVFRRNIRAAPVYKFPYVVYYQDRGTDVLIIAVQHGRRSTRGWRGRA